MKKVAAVSFAFLSVLSSGAATWDFPNDDGSFDLSSEAAWGGTLPSSTDVIELNKSYGSTLKFTQSGSFESLYFTTDRTTNTVEITDPDVTVKLLGASTSYPGIRPKSAKYAFLALKGGTYDLNGTGYVCPAPQEETDTGCGMLLDGVTVTNAAGVSLYDCYYNASPNSLKITNGSRIYTKTLGRFFYCGGYYRGGTAEISGGSQVFITGGLFNPFAQYVRNATLVIAGAGTVVSNRTGNTDKLFCSGDHNRLRIEDHAEVTLNSPWVGGGGTYETISVASGGVLRFKGTCTFPYSGSSHHITLEILEDAEVRAQKIARATHDNLIVISNGTFVAGGEGLSNSGTRNSIRIYGPKSVLSGLTYSIFGSSDGSFIEFAAGSDFDIGSLAFASSGGKSNTVSVVDGGKVTFGSFEGRSYNANTLYGCVARIVGGGTLKTTGAFTWTGHDNQTVISNGTLHVGGDYKTGDAFWAVDAEKAVTDSRCATTLQGRTPRVYTGGRSHISRGGVIRFEVPAGGYPDGDVLWDTDALQVDAGDPIKLQVAGIDEDFIKNLEAKFDVMLIHQRANLSFSLRDSLADQVEALNATLPERAKLYFSPDGFELHLSAKPPRGMVLILR